MEGGREGSSFGFTEGGIGVTEGGIGVLLALLARDSGMASPSACSPGSR
jgi:hypothetical protein